MNKIIIKKYLKKLPGQDLGDLAGIVCININEITIEIPEPKV
jgi:hypothetical protein